MFPLLPNDWKAGMELGIGDGGQSRGCCYSPCDMAYTDSYLTAAVVENNPEFFEEIRDLDYKVLKLRSLVTNDVIVSVKNNLNEIYDLTGSFSYSLKEIIENWCVKYKSWEIYSIQRVSDGEVFTIGDIVQDSSTDELTNFKFQRIVHFNYGDAIICNSESGTTMPLKCIRHAKPLFLTEDGFKIFEGDDWFCIDVSDFEFGVYLGGKNGSGSKGRLNLEDLNIKRFSTKEKAQEFLLLNKPCLSLKNIKSVLDTIHNGEFIFEKLKTLADSI